MLCIFCDVSARKGFQIVYESDQFVAFQDIAPAARLHFQVVPKKHITSIRSLSKDDSHLVISMGEIGNKILNERDVEQRMRRMGFHIPPFNSVNHLHLHVQALPYSASYKTFVYPVSKGRGQNHKGFSWFVEIGQALQILESGRRIGILPC